MKRLLLLIFMILLSLNMTAQLVVKDGSFKEVSGFVNINNEKMYDDNDKPYAVLKIKTENLDDKQRHELMFQGNAATFFEVEYKVGEVWVYLSYYATYIRISHPDLSSTEFHFPFDMKPKCGYELTVINKSIDNDVLDRIEKLEKAYNNANTKQPSETVKNTAEETSLDSEPIETDHLTFKGVPIDGTLKEYIAAMKKAGFNYKGTTNDGSAILTGDFAGYKNCSIEVSTLNNCDVVNRITVIFSDKNTWASLINDYDQIKSMLQQKYGKPKQNTEKFTSYTGDSSGLKMIALRNEELEWFTKYSTELGDVVLSLKEGTEYKTGAVKLTYYDKINSSKVQNAAMGDL